MVFKINISSKGKTLKFETENESLIGKKIGETLAGSEISDELAGYELEIKGTSDISGFPGKKDAEGSSLKKVLLTKGFSMHDKRKGVRKKKTVRGNTISTSTIQINTIVKKQGNKKFEDLLPKKEEAKEGSEAKAEGGEEAKGKEEEKPEAPKEESKEQITEQKSTEQPKPETTE